MAGIQRAAVPTGGQPTTTQRGRAQQNQTQGLLSAPSQGGLGSVNNFLVLGMQLLQLLSGAQNGKKPPTAAQQYIKGNGAFQIKPLEQGVKVHQQDDSEYYSALGYEA